MSVIKTNSHEPAVVVIGGGATGVGIARDAARRGFRVTVVERGELGCGTSGNFHGILHSGSRYAVNDPKVAAECYRENQILRRIIPSAVTDTGGLFLALNDAEAAHADILMTACGNAGIPTEEIPAHQAILAEPHISHAVIRAFTVPDGFVDGKELLRLNSEAAKHADIPATFLTHHTVTGFRSSGGKITAVVVQSSNGGPARQLDCDYVINAAGVWAGSVAGLADVPFEMVYDKGTMIVFKHSLTGAVLNRCRPENDGDLLVPGPEGSIMGTTARIIQNPDECFPTQEEVDLLISEGAAMVPQLRHAEAVRVFAGVRPLFKADPTTSADTAEAPAAGTPDSRAIPRSFRVIDHAAEGSDNFISVIGGKVTLYRLMAESAVDLLCRKAGMAQACTTASEPIKPAGQSTLRTLIAMTKIRSRTGRR